MRKRTVITETVDDVEIELLCEPVFDNVLSQKVGDKIIAAYLAHDFDPENPMQACDGDGEFITKPSRRDSSITDASIWGCHLGLDEEGEMDLTLPEIEEYAMKFLQDKVPSADLIRLMMEIDEPASKIIEYIFDEWANTGYYSLPFIWGDEDVAMLDSLPDYTKTCEKLWQELYEEGKLGTYLAVPVSWSSNNHGPGTASAYVTDVHNANAVWVPGPNEIANMSFKEGMSYMEKMQIAEKYAKGCLDTYIGWCNGDVYGCVVQVHDLEGDMIENDSCWGFFGSDSAEESLKSEFFTPTVERYLKEVEHA